jgi:sulfatase modifying factor 1
MKQWAITNSILKNAIYVICPAFSLILINISCNTNANNVTSTNKNKSIACCVKTPSRYGVTIAATKFANNANTSTNGMVLIPAGVFEMGGDNAQASADELPKHTVSVDSFYIDATEVTNAQFKKFVDATGYVTTAEKIPDWEELKKSLPPSTPKPADSMFVAASLVFKSTKGAVNLGDYSQWWNWVAGANWKHPQGPSSTIVGKDNYPVVQVSWDDAIAYCKWAGKRLPTEAEWEFAARGKLINNIYPWGNESIAVGKVKANIWEGKFPYYNALKDGFMGAAPVKSFAPNGYGLYDMAGNVWEWCSDWYNNTYYQSCKGKTMVNPQGATESYDPEEPFIKKRSLRGGSFLCNDAYCSGYRVARRMKSSPDTGLEHTGFRCVASVR